MCLGLAEQVAEVTEQRQGLLVAGGGGRVVPGIHLKGAQVGEHAGLAEPVFSPARCGEGDLVKGGELIPVTAGGQEPLIAAGRYIPRKERQVALVFDKGKVEILMHRATYQSALRYFHAFVAEKDKNGGVTAAIGQVNGRPAVVNFWRNGVDIGIQQHLRDGHSAGHCREHALTCAGRWVSVSDGQWSNPIGRSSTQRARARGLRLAGELPFTSLQRAAGRRPSVLLGLVVTVRRGSLSSNGLAALLAAQAGEVNLFRVSSGTARVLRPRPRHRGSGGESGELAVRCRCCHRCRQWPLAPLSRVISV